MAGAFGSVEKGGPFEGVSGWAKRGKLLRWVECATRRRMEPRFVPHGCGRAGRPSRGGARRRCGSSGQCAAAFVEGTRSVPATNAPLSGGAAGAAVRGREPEASYDEGRPRRAAGMDAGGPTNCRLGHGCPAGGTRRPHAVYCH